MSNSNLKKSGILIVISGPSGSGKSTISSMILDNDRNFYRSVSYTTRKIRPGETNGLEYHFIQEDEFHDMLGRGELLEHTKIHNNYYGTHIAIINNALELGKDILFDLDSHGAMMIKKKLPDHSFNVFILPPSVDELEKRLKARAQDSEETINIRIKNAREEMKSANEYDYIVMNRDIDITFKEVLNIIESERLKRRDECILG